MATCGLAASPRNTRATPTCRSVRIIDVPPWAIGVSGPIDPHPLRSGGASPANAYSTSPSTASSEHPVAAIHADGLPGDIGRVVGEEEDDGPRDLLGKTQPTEGDRVEEATLARSPHGFPLPLGSRIRAPEARGHAVDANAV